MRLAYERYEDIKQAVANTLVTAQISTLPIKCLAITKALGIACIPYSSLPTKKQKVCLEFSNEGFTFDDTIYYNDRLSPKRVRFTLMHEIGHIVLQHTEDDEKSDAEANFFAKYILVPPILVYAFDPIDTFDKESIKLVFDVSSSVAEYSIEYYYKWLKSKLSCKTFNEAELMIYGLFFDGFTVGNGLKKGC